MMPGDDLTCGVLNPDAIVPRTPAAKIRVEDSPWGILGEGREKNRTYAIYFCSPAGAAGYRVRLVPRLRHKTISQAPLAPFLPQYIFLISAKRGPDDRTRKG